MGRFHTPNIHRQLAAALSIYGTRQPENTEKTGGKCLDAARIEVGQARPLRPPENLKASGNALFAPIPASEAVNLAFACSYKRIFGCPTEIRTAIRGSRVCSLTVRRSPSRGEQDH